MPLVPPSESVSTMSTTEERAEHASLILADNRASNARPLSHPGKPNETSCNEHSYGKVMEFWIESADSLDDNSYSPLPRVHQLVPSAPTSESVARMPTTDGSEENVSLVLADCTISGDRGMLVFQAAEPDKIPVSPGEGIRYLTMRLCAIVGVAMFILLPITGGLVWFSEMRQSANFSTESDETPAQVAKSGGKVEARSTPVVASPVAENDLAATIGKPVATAPSVPAPEVAPTGGTPMPMQVANSGGKVEVRSATKVESPVAENDLAATIGKPVATAPSFPAPEVARTSGTPKPTSESALAPVSSGPMSGPALASRSAAQLDNNEIAMFVTRGKDFLKDGDVASARLLFRRAAAAGNAEATSILGTAPFLPAAEVASTGGTVKPTSESGPVSGSALASGGGTQLDNNEIAMLVTRGKGFLKDGDLASARLLFQRAAAAGNAEAAFILGTTFDPLFIRRMGVVGMEPDIARAREWYERAAELGSADASQQLTLLTRP